MKIIKQENTPIYRITFENCKLSRWIYPKRRVGRPRASWTNETINEIWDIVKRNNETYRYQPFDENNEEMRNSIKEHEEVSE